MSWVWWLSGPVVAPVLAALWSWWRARPAPQPDTPDAMRAHRSYLDALGRGAGDPQESQSPSR